MNILVYDKNENNITQNERIVKSKDIICPKFGEICLINFKDYNVILNNCKNNHKNIISLNGFDNTQNINENDIKCNICNSVSKGESYNNKFYICGTCNKNICPLCQQKHNNEHIIIEYDKKNYLIQKHNENLVSYCAQCKMNLFMLCELEHNNHKIHSIK